MCLHEEAFKRPCWSGPWFSCQGSFGGSGYFDDCFARLRTRAGSSGRRAVLNRNAVPDNLKVAQGANVHRPHIGALVK